MHSITIRPFPFPYKCAFALCSDIDLCDRELFIRIHRYLNCKKEGLGLPVADSFFASAHPTLSQLSFLTSDGNRCTEDAPFIRNCLNAGIIDSLHTWGDFNDRRVEPELIKRISEKLVNDLAAHALHIPIWINHGSKKNTQNLSSRLRSRHYCGDLPESPLYTVDNMRSLGISFYWLEEIVEWPLSNNASVAAAMNAWHTAINSLRNGLRVIQGKTHTRRPSELLRSLVVPTVLRDGTPLFGFSRYNRDPRGRWYLPTRQTIRYALTDSFLRQLISFGGYAIYYMHLGSPAYDSGSGALFDLEDRRALELLRDYYERKQIWVHTTSSVLHYWRMVNYVKWNSTETDTRIQIDITGVDDPVDGMQEPTQESLAGLTFYCAHKKETTITLKGETCRFNTYPADYTGQPSIGIAPAPVPDTSVLD